MKLLFIGDPHIKNDNHEEVTILLNLLQKICTDEKFDRIIIGGDLMHYHERIFTQALNKTLDFVTTLSRYAPVDITVGNHDMINNQQFLTSNHWLNVFKNYPNIHVIDKPVVRIFEDGSGSFAACPYVYPGRFHEALDTIEWKNCQVIFAHQEMKGCRMGSIVSTEGDEWLPAYPLLISGHIHDRQEIGKNVYYPGAPLQHGFGDTSTRVVCVIEIFDKNITKRDIPLDVPKKTMIKTSVSDLSDKTKQITLNSSLKLKLTATAEEFKLFKQTSEYKNCIEKGVKIQLVQEEQKKVSRQTGNFRSILSELILLKGDSLLKKIYGEIIK